MPEIPTDDRLVADVTWSVLGVLVSDDAWRSLALDAVLAETAAIEGGRTDALRRLAERLMRAPEATTPAPVSHARLLVAALIKDVQRYVIDLYCEEDRPGVIQEGLDWVREHLGERAVQKPLVTFTDLFPPPEVRRGEAPAAAHLEAVVAARPNRSRALRELCVLYLAVGNRAMRPFLSLFDDAELRARAHYTDTLRAIEAFFDRQPAVRGLGETLFPLLRAPLEANPDDLEGQLAYILEHWAGLLPEWLRVRLLRARDVLREETVMRGPGPGPVEGFYRGEHEYEAFTPDRDWMSNVVLIAKQTHVWLDQLSRRYGRAITRLDQVPDEELDRLARWGFTGLWLIGVWERSPASQEIKRRMGNPEAMASAYSLYDYEISEELGGELSYNDLSRRAGARGIRLAADMVPNHVGIYSRWLIEHPDWFIQLPHPPFPGYRFTGPDLSWHPGVEVRIEDGYWNHTDAAVVFQRRHSHTGELRYIYHGNDGTQMPWNDTAQLDYLNPEVREAAIQTILHVARWFPIIRFDAAMTLAKRHYRRLWFPAPGEGGAIPSRAEHGLTHAQFDEAMPKEFWREVVDRVGAELPDTLLMAEAFWLMEGYFVRTLGMHRVYNSAFMNMLKMEDNARYRQTLKDVLEFSPEVLKRFVNFMNNPDERTALEQFGKGDKYFGICTMLVTLPGLPMFGHGQIEGFGEKYGMEYPRAYWDEHADEALVARHEREIFPLMRRRHLFSHADSFVFYDFFTGGGFVNEDVFAYSNRGGGESALVVYNNAYRSTAGWIRTGTPINVGRGAETHLVRPTLAEGLALDTADDCLYAFRDHNRGLEFLRSGRELADRGLFVELSGYQTHVFLDWRAILAADELWWQLHRELNGGGVPDVDEARLELQLRPAREAFAALITPARVGAFLGETPAASVEEAEVEGEAAALPETALEVVQVDIEQERASFFEDFERFLEIADAFDPGVDNGAARLADLRARTDRLLAARGAHPSPPPPAGDGDRRELWRLGLLWALLRSLGETSRQASERVAAWRLGGVLEQAFEDCDPEVARCTARLASILLDHSPTAIGRAFFDRTDIREQLLVHEYEGTLWFHKERMDQLLDAIRLAHTIEHERPVPNKLKGLGDVYASSAFQYDKLLAGLGETQVSWVPEEVEEISQKT